MSEETKNEENSEEIVDGEHSEQSKKRFRKIGGGRKAAAPEIRDSLFTWFIGK